MIEKVQKVTVEVEKYKCPICDTMYDEKDDADYCFERGRSKVEMSDVRGHSNIYWEVGDYILNTHYGTAVKIIGQKERRHAILPVVIDANNNTLVPEGSLFNTILPRKLVKPYVDDINKILKLEAENGKG